MQATVLQTSTTNGVHPLAAYKRQRSLVAISSTCCTLPAVARRYRPVTTKFLTCLPLVKPCIVVAKAADSTDEPSKSSQEDNSVVTMLLSAGIFAIWGAIMYYVLFLAPNQTPLRDSYFLEKLLGQDSDGLGINRVFTQIWNLMAIWPMIYACLLIPSGRSNTSSPAWPFVSASFILGMYALIPYFGLWRAAQEDKTGPVPPTADTMTGWQTGLKLTESPILAALLLGTSAWLLFQLVTSPGSAWYEYDRLLDESRLVHATSLDFLLFTAFVPFWMYNDAQRRDWGPRDVAVPLLSLLPVVGPCLYLLVRPRAQ